jgi:sterol 3beta-glucosyltransferase
MKIGIQTWGSHGDIRPFLALAEGLQAAGNEVHLVLTCVDDGLDQGIVSRHGVRITVLASPVLSPEQQEETGRIAYRTRNPMTQMAAILRLCFAPVEDIMFDAAQSLCAESDIVIGHYFMHPLQIAAEKAGRPYLSVLLSHVAVPSDFNHPLGSFTFGKPVHRLLWWLVRTMLNRILLHYPNRLRGRLGMPPESDIVTRVWLSKHLTLLAVSPQICNAQPDWPDSVRVCGFLGATDPQADIAGQLPGTLAGFLDAGEAPVYMSFGSWMPQDIAGQTRALQLLTQAAKLAGCRAIIQSPSADACGFRSDRQILYITAAPHHAIFPRCRAVVHHGGAGTTQSATLAGKPSIVVANISEQEHWAGELRRLGIAGRPARRRSITAAALARRIEQVLAAPDMTLKAETIARAMKNERGVDKAVELVMERFGGHILSTERTRLRRIFLDDAEFMLGLLNDPSWLRCIGDRGVRSIEDARNYILKGPVDSYKQHGFGFYIVELKQTGTPMGICGLAKRDFLDDVDIGYAFMPQFCGQGYAFEAARAVLSHAQNDMGLKRVVATSRPENTSSARILDKLGMRFQQMIKSADGTRELKLFAIDSSIRFDRESEKPK